jgi:hypothetical protein
MVLLKTMSMAVSGFAAVAGVTLGPSAVRSAGAAADPGDGGANYSHHHHEVGALNRFHIADVAHNNNVTEEILVHGPHGTVKRISR